MTLRPFLWLLALLGAAVARAEDSSGVSIAPAAAAITSSTADVRTAAAAVVVLLSSLLAIALVVSLYKGLASNK